MEQEKAESAPAARLLVVDDTEDNRDMLSRRLQRRGYEVLVAEDGEQALELLENETIDLVLLDIMMPGIDGIEVLRRIRSTHSQGQLPVIMATARAGSTDVVEALELGANDYVTKPLDFPVVLARVQTQLRTRETARSDGVASARGGADGIPGAGVSTGDIAVGHVIAGRYRIDDRIGTGTFGAVFRAQHLELDHPVAVKILLPNVTARKEAARRFRQEGVAACRVQHPNAVRVTDFGVTQQNIAYLVMELLDGTTLVQELEEWKRLSPRRCLEILGPVCEVLAVAHGQELVHRDIKPENIFLHQADQSGEHREVVKLLDFGIAKLVGDNVTQENLTAEGWVLGTPAYMAPERLSNRPYDGRADVYSLGVMLFEMLTGRRPFLPRNNDAMSMILQHVNDAPPTLRSVHPAVPATFEPLVARCLGKNPDHRPTAAELRHELAALVDQVESMETVSVRPMPPSHPGIDPGAPTLAIDSGGTHLPDTREEGPAFDPSPMADDDDPEVGNLVSRWIRKLRRG